MKAFISRIEKILPGIRLKEKLSKAGCHQDIADILSLHGKYAIEIDLGLQTYDCSNRSLECLCT